MRIKPQLGVAVALWLALCAALAELTSRVGDWFVMTDELLYERLALSIDRLHSPLPHVHGVIVANVNQLYPLLLAPVFAGGTIQHDLRNAHVLNAIVMTSAALPAYLLARRLATPTWAVFAALLTVVVPWIALSSFLLTEVAAYPAFVWALLAFHAAVERPSARNDALATLALVVAIGARTQLAVLAIVLPVAIALHSRARRHTVLIVVYALGVVLALVALALGHNPLGTYESTAHGNPVPAAFFPALLTHVSQLALGFGLLPFLIGGAWLVARARRDVFATIGCTAIAVVVIEVASYDVRFGGNIVRDRYLFYLAPIVALALVAALSGATARPQWLAVPLALLIGGFALSPLPLFDKLNVDTPTSILDNYLRGHIGGLTGARIFLVVAALLAVVLVVEAELLLRRSWLVALVAVLALVGTTARTAYAFERLFRVNGTAGRPLTAKPGPVVGWVDGAIGRDAHVTAVPYPTLVSDYWASAAFWWDAEFWNASVDRTAGVPGEFEWTPSTFPKLDLRLDRIGRSSISRPGDVLQALGDTRFHLAGTVVMLNRGVFLVEPERPWRADWSTSGLFDDGWTRPGAVAHIHVYPYPGQGTPVTRTVTVSLFAPSGVTTRPFALSSNLGAASGAAGPNEVSQEIAVCVPPDRPADARLSVIGSSLVAGDLRTPETFSSPRRAGAFVSRIYLSGAVGAACQVRKA
jgi:hypothetical protein